MTKITPLAAAGVLLIGTTVPAHAYIDPSAGTFILQILAAVGLGAAFYFRRSVSAMKRLFRGGRGADLKNEHEPDQDRTV